jgi:Leucine-rich repeat (LRR) protein
MFEAETSEWMQLLQILSDIPGIQLRRVFWGHSNADQNHPCITQWLRQHGKAINHLHVEAGISEDRLNLRELVEAAAPCRSMDLFIVHHPNQVIDLAKLATLGGSLRYFRCDSYIDDGILSGVRALSSLQNLTRLDLCNEAISDDQPWDHLAKLTNLEQLSLKGSASGDPSPLSALTRLSSLCFSSRDGNHADPFSFSSLQPLSTLQQLETLQLQGCACKASSLQGLAGLSNLRELDFAILFDGELRSLEGIGSGVAMLSLEAAFKLVTVAGIERCSSMKSLSLYNCGVSSLQPLKGLSSLERLEVYNINLTSLEGICGTSLHSLGLSHCDLLTNLAGVEQLIVLSRLVLYECRVTSLQPISQLGLQTLCVRRCSGVQEEVLELPHVHTSANVDVCDSGALRKVVLAGGVSRTVFE